MKREREKKITRLHIILFVLVVTITIITIVAIKSGGNKKLEKYKRLEKNLTTATIYYYGEQAKELGKGQIKIITMKDITDHGYLQDSLTSECVGYTVVGNYKVLDGYEVGYDTYIKCGDSYTTDGFEAKYAK